MTDERHDDNVRANSGGGGQPLLSDKQREGEGSPSLADFAVQTLMGRLSAIRDKALLLGATIDGTNPPGAAWVSVRNQYDELVALLDGVPSATTRIEELERQLDELRVKELDRRLDSAPSATQASPDGYAVVMQDGHFVGIWRQEETAKAIVNRSPSAKGERIEPMVFLKNAAAQASANGLSAPNAAASDSVADAVLPASAAPAKRETCCGEWASPEGKCADCPVLGGTGPAPSARQGSEQSGTTTNATKGKS